MTRTPTRPRSPAKRRRRKAAPLPPAPSRFTAVRASSRDITVLGAERGGLTDLYHTILTMPGWAFALALAATYLVVNALFAGLYMLDPGGLDHVRPGSFADAFFFSVQTLSTIGYGVMTPKSAYANTVVVAEALAALGLVGVTTGLIFARFSRPTARVMFSKLAVITTFDGRPTLMFRAANQRGDQILQAEVTVDLLRWITTTEGHAFRRFQQLPMVRSRTPMFALSWTMMHTIDENSPLHGVTQEQLAAWDVELVVMLSGIDEIFAQPIHARHSYIADEIIWNRRFEEIISTDEDGRRVVNYHRFHDVRDDEPDASN
jgi:inward rectifier potassium channel